MSGRLNQLQVLLLPVIEALGYCLWGVELLAQGKHSVLRVYIDNDPGITVDDCEKVSRQISALLDVEDPISEAYTLMVSSPGLDRPLFTAEQFAAYVGSLIQVRLRVPFEGRRNYQGLLSGLEDGDVVLRVDDHEYLLPMDSIAKARLVPQFD